MNKIEIFVHDDSNDYEYEFGIQKGYWDNIYVRKEGKVFRVNIITLERLNLDCQSSDLEWFGFFTHSPNLLIVDKASKTNIIKTILKQNEQGFFENLADCNLNGEILADRNEEHWLSKEKRTFGLNELHKIYDGEAT